MDGDGYSSTQDCDDSDPGIHPDAEDLDTDGIDQNCDNIDGLDADGDGYADAQVGGDDCDDSDPLVHPAQPESCDTVDQNCNDTLNDGVDCYLYVHAFEELYRVDPFLLHIETLSPAPGLFDSAMHPSGMLLGISDTQLLAYDVSESSWSVIGETGIDGEGLNGLAIDQSGRAFGTIGSTLYQLDIETGLATEVGLIGDSFRSSGDCAIDAEGRLYMTSLTASNQDDLVRIDPDTAQGTRIGNTGESGIYALSAAWGHLFGFTVSGKLLAIDVETGESTLLHTFEGYSFTGAASGHER